jgi:hypothetical protein
MNCSPQSSFCQKLFHPYLTLALLGLSLPDLSFEKLSETVFFLLFPRPQEFLILHSFHIFFFHHFVSELHCTACDGTGRAGMGCPLKKVVLKSYHVTLRENM